jgi:hypothetical protein
MDAAHAPDAGGVLVDLSLMGNVDYRSRGAIPRRIVISVRSKRRIICTTATWSFYRRNHGRKLREVMDGEMDIADVIQ